MALINQDESMFCRVCDQEQLTFIKYLHSEFDGSEISFFKCNNCFSYFSTPPIHQNQISEGGLGAIYYGENSKKFVKDLFSFAFEKRWLTNESKEFLDIGCSVGWSLIVAQELGFNAYGIEASKDTSSYAREKLKLNVKTGIFDPNLYEKKIFDFIILNQVLEHVPTPKKMFSDILQLLKPNGILFLGVPPIDWSRKWTSLSFNFSYNFKKFNWNKNEFLRKLKPLIIRFDMFWPPEGHINSFSSKAIEMLSRDCDAQLLGQYHRQRWRAEIFPSLRLTTGSYFIRKPN